MDNRYEKDNGVEISSGVYLEDLKNGFQAMEIRCSIGYETALKIKESNVLSFEMNISDSKDSIILGIYSVSQESLINIPITISNKLVNFLNAKVDSPLNEIYLNIYDETQNFICAKKIIQNGSVTIIDRLLQKLSNNN